MTSSYQRKPKNMKKEEFQEEFDEDIKVKDKPSLVIFDLDGTLADSDDFILTNKQAYEKEPELFAQKPSKDTENIFCDVYFKHHHKEIEPYEGTLRLFIAMAKTDNVAIITSRKDILQPLTVEWLKTNVIALTSETVWRSIRYKLIFNEKKEKSLEYKRKAITKLADTYKISLIIDDHPDIIEWAKKQGIEVLIPGNGYKDLNGKDLAIPKEKKESEVPLVKPEPKVEITADRIALYQEMKKTVKDIIIASFKEMSKQVNDDLILLLKDYIEKDKVNAGIGVQRTKQVHTKSKRISS